MLPHTVFRGGVGLFYNASGSEAGNMRLARNLPFGLTYQISPGDVTVGPTVSEGFPPLQPIIIPPTPNGVGYGVAPNFRPSYAEQFNWGVEQEIVPLEMVLKFVGVGNLGRHLQDTWNANQPIPGSTSTVSRRPLYAIDPAQSDVNYYISDGFAEYFAFQFTADKRLSHGVSALLGYAYSHAIDDVPLEFGGGDAGPNPQDPRFPHEVSNSIIDQRQRLTLSYLWALPFGKGQKFSITAKIVNFVSGRLADQRDSVHAERPWFSPVLQTSTTNTGTSSRPNIIGPVVYPKLSCTGSAHRRLALRRRTPTAMRAATRCSVRGGQTLTHLSLRPSRFMNRCSSSSVWKRLTSSTIRSLGIRIRPSEIRRWVRLRRLSATLVTCRPRSGSSSSQWMRLRRMHTPVRGDVFLREQPREHSHNGQAMRMDHDA